MQRSSILFTFTTGFALCALHCSADNTAPSSSTSGTSNDAAGQSGARGGAAGSVTGTAGSVAGTSPSGAGAGGASAGASAGGSPFGGVGSIGASGTVGAGAGGVATAGAAGSGSGLSGLGAGGGGMGGTGTSGASGSSTAGSGAAGAATSMFTPVAEIIGANCATSKCHPNDKGVHADLHNDDGKLYERLLATGNTIPMAKDACKNLPLVVPGSPDTSLIMAMIVADDTKRSECGNRMPYKCPDEMNMTVCLTDPDIETIRAWIAAGALP